MLVVAITMTLGYNAQQISTPDRVGMLDCIPSVGVSKKPNNKTCSPPNMNCVLPMYL